MSSIKIRCANCRLHIPYIGQEVKAQICPYCRSRVRPDRPSRWQVRKRIRVFAASTLIAFVIVLWLATHSP